MNRFLDNKQSAEACGEYIASLLEMAIAQNGRAMLAVSGGSSPKPMFEYFSRRELAWEKVHVFFVDERGVPPTDPQSNFKMAHDAWLKSSKATVHRIQAELDPHEAARKYTDEMREAFGIVPGDTPIFDVIHQGMGPEGHTASLFPGDPLIEDRRGLVAATYVEKVKMWRITTLPGVLIAAKNTAMLVAGRDKAETLDAVLNGPYDPMQYPIQVVARNARSVEWFVDF
jgi:6-phosphogluconolactonase